MRALLERAVAAFRLQPEAGARRGSPPAWTGTGGLLNNSRAADRTPFFLTARHHFLFGGDGVRLGFYPSFEAVWDFTPEAARQGDLARLPRSRGATLLACDAATDSALLLLEGIPPGRTFLGWRAANVYDDELHRLSHPYGYPQTYTCHSGRGPYVAAAAPVSLGAPGQGGSTPHRLDQTRFEGTLGPGSSGAPLVTLDLRVVGQLWGVCERNGVAYALDGAFVHAYGKIRRWLDPLGKGEAPAFHEDRVAVYSSTTSQTFTSPPLGTS